MKNGTPAQQALVSSEARLRALAAVASDVVYWMSADWSELRLLQGREFIADTSEPTQSWLEKYIHPDDRSAVMGHVQEAIRSRGVFELEHRVLRADGTLAWSHSRAIPILDDQGAILEWVGTATDVTSRKQDQERLATQRRHYEAILTNTPDLAYIFDRDHRFVYANEGLLRMWGKTWDEAIGKTCLELGYPDWHAAMHDREIDQIVATKQPVRGEVPFTGTFGTRIYDYLLVPVLGENGEVEAVAGTTRDITDRRRTEQALRESEQRLQLALLAGKSATFDWDLRTGHVSVSSYYTQLHGLSPDETVNYDTWLAAIHPLDRERARLLATDVINAGTDWRFDYRLRPSASAERWLSSIGRFERDADSRPIRFSGIAFDVTESKVSEQALRHAKERLTQALSAARMAAWDWDPETDEVTTSESFSGIFGLLPGEQLTRGADAEQLIYPDDFANHRHVVEAAVRELGDWHHEMRVIRPIDGKIVWLEERAHAVRDPETGRLKVSGLVWDVTSRKELEASLREADRRKDEFLATLAHELRNPMAPIRNAAELLKRSQVADPHLRTARDIIDRQVRHMVRLVDDLMDVSRITLGQVTLRHERVSLRTILTEALETAAPLIESQRHALVVQLPAEALQIDGDPTRLSQVFQNLLNNAAKYTPAGGQITLRAERQQNEAKISVRDTGLGIAKESQSRVFDLFSRVHPEDLVKTRGLGIGLALAKQLIELHGGRIEVQSAGTGTGSEFTVYLPTLPAATTSHNTSTVEPDSNNVLQRRVLIVDDNQDAGESLGMLLSMQGCSVKVALDGLEALADLESFEPEVVLLDIGMPGMDGYEVARRMRARPLGRAAVLVALTGWGQPEDKRRSAEAGFDDHLTKPVDPGVLSTVLSMQRPAAVP
jgi:PAS domain S-box-containing protein